MSRRSFPLSGSGPGPVRAITAICVLALMTACGGGNRAADVGTTTGTPAGTITMTVEWEPPSASLRASMAKGLSIRPMAPAIDVCTDYGIKKVRMKVWSGVTTLLADGSEDCSQHQLKLSNVPAGNNLTIQLMGDISDLGGDNTWNGWSPPFTLNPNDNVNTGITMKYAPPGGGDKIPPTITDFSPKDNETNVANSATIQVVFGEPMAVNTVIDNGTFVVLDNASKRVSGTFIPSIPPTGTSTFIFQPNSPLASGGKYTVAIDNTFVTDMAGNALNVPKTWSFTVHEKGTWFPPYKINKGFFIASLEPHISASGDGKAVLTWLETTAQYSDPKTIHFSWLDPAKKVWSSAPEDTFTRTSTITSSPKVAISQNGNAFALWPEMDTVGHYNLWAMQYLVGQGWTNVIETDKSANTAKSQHDLALDDVGNAFMDWYRNSYHGDVFHNHYILGTGMGGTYMGASGSASRVNYLSNVAAAGDRNAFIVWGQWDNTNKNYQIYSRRYKPGTGGGSNWDTVIQIPNSRFNSSYDYYFNNIPSVAVDENGTAFAAWNTYDNVTNIYSIVASRFDGSISSWGGIASIADNTSSPIDIRMDKYGNAIVVWSKWPNIHAKRYDPIKGWDNAVSLGSVMPDSSNYSVKFAMNREGHAVVVLGELHSPSTLTLKSNRYTPGAGWRGWIPVTTVNVSSWGEWDLAIDSVGNAYLVWIEDIKLLGGNNIWAAYSD